MEAAIYIDEDLKDQLERQAEQEAIPIAELANRVVRLGLDSVRQSNGEKKPFRQQTFDVGVPLVDLTKIHQVLGDMDVEEYLKKFGPAT